jgi:hypothetical protein
MTEHALTVAADQDGLTRSAAGRPSAEPALKAAATQAGLLYARTATLRPHRSDDGEAGLALLTAARPGRGRPQGQAGDARAA